MIREPSFFPSDLEIAEAALWAASRTARREGRDIVPPAVDAVAPCQGPRRAGWSTHSSFRGVYPTPEGRWAAKIRVGGKLHYVGNFDTEEAAARAVDAKGVELLGEAWRCNLPDACGVGEESEGERRPKRSTVELTRQQVVAIRLTYACRGATQQELAERFGVSAEFISKLIHGKCRASWGGPISGKDHRHNNGRKRTAKNQALADALVARGGGRAGDEDEDEDEGKGERKGKGTTS